MSTNNDQLLALAIEIANALGEVNNSARIQVAMVVAGLGAEGARELLEQARSIHEGAGLFCSNGKRRTFGGTFFALARKLRQAGVVDDEKEAARQRGRQRKAKHQAYVEEVLERYRTQKAELLAAREELAKEKELREKAEQELAALRSQQAKSMINATPAKRSSAPPPRGRVYRAPDF